MGDDWMAFARFLQRERTVQPARQRVLGHELLRRRLAVRPRPDPDGRSSSVATHTSEPTAGFHIGADRAMFGVDYPHFESIFPATMDKVGRLVTDPCVTESDARKILVSATRPRSTASTSPRWSPTSTASASPSTR